MILTKSEMEIMDVLWVAQKPMSRSDLLEYSPDKSWKDSSVHILLNGLLKKGVIQEVGFVKRSKTYGRTFAPTMSREEYFAVSVFSHKNKPNVLGLIQAILKNGSLTREQLMMIRDQIGEKLEEQ